MKLSFSSLLSLGFESSRIKFSWNLSRLFHCSVIKELFRSCDSSLSLSQLFCSVKNFFIFFVAAYQQQLVYNIKLSTICQQLFIIFLLRFFANLLLSAVRELSYQNPLTLSRRFFFYLIIHESYSRLELPVVSLADTF